MRPLFLPLSIAAVFVIPAVPLLCLADESDYGKSPVFTHAAAADAAPSSSNGSITLAQAWKFAEDANPTLRQAQAQRALAQGDAADARSLLWNNPKLTSERVRREVPQLGTASENRREWSAGIEQSFEIAGQQGYRRQAAQQQLNAVDATIEDTRREVRAEVERRFVQVLSLQERISTERQSLSIIENTTLSVKKRVAAGEDSKLDGNLASVEAVRARNQIGVLEEQWIQARADLAAVMQQPSDVLPVVSGSLTVPAPTYSLQALLTHAADRPLLHALDYREQAAQSRLSLERSARIPDITVALGTGREGASYAQERLTKLTVSLPLPLFRQNAGAIGRASTELMQAQIERQASLRNTSNNIAALWQKLQSLTVRLDALQQTVLPALEENQRLSVKSMQAGEIGLFQLLLVNRQVLDGRRDLIDAQTELRLTRIALHQAAGWNESGAAP